MSERVITFGGEVIPAHVATAPHIIRPVRKMSVVQIAGTNRELVDMEDAWDCYDQTYSMYLGNGEENSIQEALSEVARVLFKNGWQVLIDDYEPDYYRLAYYQGGFDSDNRYTRLGKFDISFRCRPERFLMAGNGDIIVSSGDTIKNPTAYPAKPLIRITGGGSGILTVAGTVMSFTDIADYLYIDCDTMDVYRQIAENRNNLMTGSFPVLPSGDSTITFTGGIESVTISPRFYVI